MRKNYERTVFLIAFEGDHWVCRDVLCVFLMCFKCSYPQPPRHALVTVFKCFFKRLDVRGGRRVLSEIRFEAHPKQIQTTTKQTTTVSSQGEVRSQITFRSSPETASNKNQTKGNHFRPEGGSFPKSRYEAHPKQNRRSLMFKSN